MPRISDTILDSTVYLYPSKEAAEEGERAGGSGFLVGIPSKVEGGYIYAVTNSHVIREGGSPVVRLNTIDGVSNVLSLEMHDWCHHPDGDDLAVCSIGGLLSGRRFKYKHIPVDMLITDEIITQEDIGPGDEVFMVGRFVSHEGKQRNIPTLRFGNVAMMPLEPIQHSRGHLQESFLVETRSLSGFSGSPVFVHILPFSKRPGIDGWSAERGPWLLGVDWGHIHFDERVLEKNIDEHGIDVPVEEGWRVRTNSGMAAVVPAWKLSELLDTKPLREARERRDIRLAEGKEKTNN